MRPWTAMPRWSMLAISRARAGRIAEPFSTCIDPAGDDRRPCMIYRSRPQLAQRRVAPRSVSLISSAGRLLSERCNEYCSLSIYVSHSACDRDSPLPRRSVTKSSTPGCSIRVLWPVVATSPSEFDSATISILWLAGPTENACRGLAASACGAKFATSFGSLLGLRSGLAR